MSNLANVIKIKRSTGTSAPGALKSGELAYSWGAGTNSNGGARLFFGSGDDGSGNATLISSIGGLYYTGLIDASTPGTLNTSASSIPVLNSSGKIDDWKVGNLELTGNTFSSTDTNGNINITPNGSGYVTIGGTNALVIPSGTTGQQAPAVTGAIRYNTTTSSFEGYTGASGSGNWTSLGGVRSVDGKAYIIAETAPAAGDDTLHFYASSDGTGSGTSTQYLTINGTGFKVGAVDFSINTNKFTVASSTGNTAVAGTLNVTGHVTLEGVTSTGATGTGKLVFDTAPTISGHPTIEGVTSTGATGTGNLVFSASPTFTGTLTADAISVTSLAVDNITDGYATTVTAAGTTTLTSTSKYQQYFTGTTTQTVLLPVTSTLVLGKQYQVVNNSTGNVTVQSSGANNIFVMPSGTVANFTVVAITGTTAASWNADYVGFSSITGTGSAVLATSPTLVTPTLGAATATSINGLTISTTTGTLTIANGKTLTASNTLTFTGTDSSSVAFGAGGTVTYTSNKLSVFSATTSAELAGVISDETGTGVLVFGTSPAFTTSVTTASTSFDLFNTGATTVNAFGAATTVGIGATGSATTITLGGANTGNTLKIAGTASGTTSLTTDVTTGIVNLANGVTTGTVNIATGGASTVNIGGTGSTTVVKHLTVEGVTSSGATGTTNIVFSNSPTLVTPTLGAATATSINGLTITSSTGTLTVANGKTLTASNTLTFTGTDSSSVAFGAGGTVTYTSNKLSVFSATSSSELAGVISDETGTGSLVFGTSPTFTTSLLTPVVTTSGATSLTLNTNSNSGPGASVTVQSGTNSNVNLAPSGTGTVDVGSARITSLATPTQSTDAATKAYVDATSTGLDVKQSVRMATTANLTATASGTGLGKTLTNSGTQAVFAVDGVTAVVGDRVLVKNQATTANNGIYTVTTVGTVSTNWVLTRATDADNSTPTTEVTPGMFTFIEEGSTLANTGWVLSTTGAITLDTTGLTFTQFSGAGTYLASNGVQLVGNTFSVNLGTNSSLTTTGGTLQVDSGIAGNGLTYTNGVIDVVGTTNRISVTANAIDISSSYVGQNTITTLGTVTTGTWNANVLTYAYGGTGQSSYAKGDILYASATNTLSTLTAGTDGMVLQQQSGVPSWGYLDGGTY